MKHAAHGALNALLSAAAAASLSLLLLSCLSTDPTPAGNSSGDDSAEERKSTRSSASPEASALQAPEEIPQREAGKEAAEKTEKERPAGKESQEDLAEDLPAPEAPRADLPSLGVHDLLTVNVAPPWAPPEAFNSSFLIGSTPLPLPSRPGEESEMPRQTGEKPEEESRRAETEEHEESEDFRKQQGQSAQETAEMSAQQSSAERAEQRPEERAEETAGQRLSASSAGRQPRVSAAGRGNAAGRGEETEPTAGQEKEEPDRRVWAVPGEKIDLALPEYGWVYRQGQGAGSGSGGERQEPVSFARRSYEQGETLFLFDALRKGRQVLRFVREDAAAGVRAERIIEVNVVSEEERKRRISRADDGGDAARGESPNEREADVASADTVSAGDRDGGRREEELLRAAREGSLDPLATARSLMDSGEERLAESLLRYYLGELSDDDYRRGDVLYYLGRLYEAPGPLRNERKAVEYYERAVRGYPGSSHWEEAGERSNYLKRNYINIR